KLYTESVSICGQLNKHKYFQTVGFSKGQKYKRAERTWSFKLHLFVFSDMATVGYVLSKEQLLCPICLDLFEQPVSTPCGHNFCHDCIKKYWKSVTLPQCPMCKHKLYKRPNLKVNTFISEVASQFKQLLEKKSKTNVVDQSTSRKEEISCDVCLGKEIKALKSCLDCLASFVRRIWSLIMFLPPSRKSSEVFDNLLQLVQRGHEDVRARRYAVDVTLDPNTAHPKLVVVPDNPERFYPGVSVLGKEGFSSGKFYFEVQVEGKTEWDIGIGLESVSRKGGCILNPERGYWALGMRSDQSYWALDNPPVCVPLIEKPHSVGVYVDMGWGQVSFYNADTHSHIFTFTGYSFSGRVFPYLNPRRNHGGVNSVPLIILPVNVLCFK
uniref:Uncharacterized protein n=1 Tax=Gouania willdenowi TaxID=441366 RepID=A0A8C5GIK8_GOUWI